MCTNHLSKSNTEDRNDNSDDEDNDNADDGFRTMMETRKRMKTMIVYIL